MAMKSFAATRNECGPRRISVALGSRADAALEGPGDQWRDGVPRQCTGHGLLTASQDQSVERVPDPGRVEVRVEHAFVLSPFDQVDQQLLVRGLGRSDIAEHRRVTEEEDQPFTD